MSDFLPLSESTVSKREDAALLPLFNAFLSAVSRATGMVLSLFDDDGRRLTPVFGGNRFCEILMRHPLHRSRCLSLHRQGSQNALAVNEPVSFACDLGLLNLAVPLLHPEQPPVLLGGGLVASLPPSALGKQQLAALKSLSPSIVEEYFRIPILSREEFEREAAAISEFCAGLLEDRRSSSELRKTVERWARLPEISAQACAETPPSLLVSDLAKKIIEIAGAGYCRLLLLDPVRRHLLGFASSGSGREEEEEIRKAVSEGIFDAYLSAERPLFHHQGGFPGTRFFPSGKKHFKSFVTLPLRTSGQVSGLLSLAFTARDSAGGEAEKFILALGEQAATALEKSALGEEIRRRTQEVELSQSRIHSCVSRMGEVLSSSLNPDHLLRPILEICMRLSEADAGSIYLVEKRSLVTQVRVGFEEETQPALSSRIRESLVGWPLARDKVSGSEGAFRVQEAVFGEPSSSRSFASYFGIPLTQKEDTKGVINLFFRSHKRLSLEIIRLLSFFAAQAALAMENARLFELEKRKASEMSHLYNAVRAVGQAPDFQDVLWTTAKQMARLADVNRCIILLLDEKGGEFKTATSFGLNPEQKDFFAYFSIPLKQISEEFLENLREGKHLLLERAPRESPALEKLMMLLPSSFCLVAPLLSDEKLLGMALLDDSHLPHPFTPSHVRTVMTLAIHAGTAIHRASLLMEQEKNLRHLSTLSQITSTISQILSLPKVIELVVEKAGLLVPLAATALLTWDEKKKTFTLQGFRPSEGRPDSDLLAELALQALQRKKPGVHTFTPEEVAGTFLEEAGIGGFLSFPLTTRKRLLGMLLCFSGKKRPFNPEEVRLLKSFSQQAIIAMENARLYGINKDKVQELATLFEVGKSITSTLNLKELLDEIAEIVSHIMKADAASILLMDGDSWELVTAAARGLGKDHLKERHPLGTSPFNLALRAQTHIIFQEAEGTPPAQAVPPKIRKEGFRSVLSVPLRAKGKDVGVMNVLLKEPRPFEEPEINLLTTLGNQAAMAIENALLYEEQAAMARNLQALLMPQPKLVFPGLQMGHIYIPSKELSGDYYDVIPLGAHKAGLTISDVSGKGTQAAVYTARGKYILKSYATADYAPAEVLSRVNSLMSHEAEKEKFISLFYAVADLTKKELTFSNAGHPPPLFWDASKKEALCLENDGLLIGIMKDAAYTQEKIKFSPGDILLLYTDGISDARSPEGELFGSERLVDLIRRYSNLSPQEIADKVHTGVKKFSRRKPSDDFTLLVVRF